MISVQDGVFVIVTLIILGNIIKSIHMYIMSDSVAAHKDKDWNN